MASATCMRPSILGDMAGARLEMPEGRGEKRPERKVEGTEAEEVPRTSIGTGPLKGGEGDGTAAGTSVSYAGSRSASLATTRRANAAGLRMGSPRRPLASRFARGYHLCGHFNRCGTAPSAHTRARRQHTWFRNALGRQFGVCGFVLVPTRVPTYSGHRLVCKRLRPRRVHFLRKSALNQPSLSRSYQSKMPPCQ